MLEQDSLQKLAGMQNSVGALQARSVEEQQRLSYRHTLREICQQPSTWIHTARLMRDCSDSLRSSLSSISALTLTGSGSSEYAGDCVRLALQNELGIVTEAIGGGALLAHGSSVLPPGRPALLAHRIRQLLAHPMLLAAFSAAAADRVRSRYSWDRIAQETAAVYEALDAAAKTAA